MDELEEILYEYRLGLRGLPTYKELLELNEIIDDRLHYEYNRGWNDA